MPADSMAPTLMKNDVLVTNRLAYLSGQPHDGDIVVVSPPIARSNPFIKRVVAVPGDRMRITKGALYVNDVRVSEPYIAHPADYDFEVKQYGLYVDGVPLERSQANVPSRSSWTAPNTVPSGCFIVLGDNRPDSEDSHIWGCAQNGGVFFSGAIEGHPVASMERAMMIILPSDRRRSLL
jgi:signal peptidase I